MRRMETKSELKVVVAYLLIIGAYLLGFDIQQIMLYMADAETYVRDIRELVKASADKDMTAIIGGLAPIVYTIARTWKKGKSGQVIAQ